MSGLLGGAVTGIAVGSESGCRSRNLKTMSALLVAAGCLLVAESAAQADDTPTPKLALSFRPRQADVDYETPTEAEFAKCKVQVERKGKASGWVVLGPEGQILRRYIDTNADNVVDQWRYYNHGLEVYRDVDRNFNNRIDECRWLNSGGTRWGLDTNEDGIIDSWKRISAEEVSRETIRALTTGDVRLLQTVLVTEEELKSLGVSEDLIKEIMAKVAQPEAHLKKVRSTSRAITAKSTWMRFDSSMPGVIPADEGKATTDLTLYQNAMAIAESSSRPVLVQLGELIQVGDVWKLTSLPQPLEGETVQIAGGVLMRPVATSDLPVAGVGTITPEMQKLLDQLQKLDGSAPSPGSGADQLTSYNENRANLLAQMVNLASTEEEKGQWMRQMVDGIAAAVQTGSYPKGVERLKTIEADVRRTSPKSELVPYVEYRRMLAEYTIDLQSSDNDGRQELQAGWLKRLEEFAGRYPDADETSEAMLQLAIMHEFNGRLKEARDWYSRTVVKSADSRAGIRAAGAQRRLDLKDKPITVAGPGLKGGTIDAASFKGKVLLVLYWSTWCKPCLEELPQIRALYSQYHSQGFEILGVNLDTTSDPVDAYLKQYNVTWPQIHADGGLESEPALEMGIISLPTMILVGRDGKVEHRSISVPDLKQAIPDLLKKR
ncbi:MAG: redoxin domain-containing protein [Planctomycetaceae bacterium]|nr:redoxin domain-containing protein [Planctomycetaceae bacterium]